MRKIAAVAALSLGLLFHPALSFAQQAPDGVIELSGGSVAAGVGFTWGDGTLIFHGQRYPITVSGVSLASVGATQYTAAGSVYGLKNPQDIDGVFTSAAVGATVGGGGAAAAMQNQNGVTIQLASTTQGLGLTLAAEGVKISLAH